jgi:hypothetical protein
MGALIMDQAIAVLQDLTEELKSVLNLFLFADRNNETVICINAALRLIAQLISLIVSLQRSTSDGPRPSKDVEWTS